MTTRNDSRLHPVLKAVFLVIGIALGTAAGVVAVDASAEQPSAAPPVIQDARICAAVTVYTQAPSDAWDVRAAIAQTALNSFEAAGEVPDCGTSLAAALAGRFIPRSWQDALDAVDAVRSGSYLVPDVCARATAVFPLSPPLHPMAADTAPPAVARAQCVISDLVFVDLSA